VKKNRYKKILSHLKSTELDEKIQSLNEGPTNHISGVYSLNSPGLGVSKNNSTKTFYPDIDGNWPKGIPEEDPYIKYTGYWGGGHDWESINTTDFSQKYLINDSTGKSTEGLIRPDGTVVAQLPPNSKNFILGPLVDGFYSEGDKSYTNIGYLQKDTRQFVLLARIEGQWKDDMNGSHSVWDGTSNGVRIYNNNFTIEMAQWIRDKVLSGNYIKNVPYFYAGGSTEKIECPKCPPNMKGGNGIGPNVDIQSTEKTDFDLELDELISDGQSSQKIYFALGKYSQENNLDIKQMEDLLKKTKFNAPGNR
jgi:hypothetical protein